MTDEEFRDDFGDELVDALNIRARDGVTVDTAVAVRRRARRVRTRRILTAAAAVVLIAAGIGAAVATSRRGPGHLSVATSPSGTTGIPSSFGPLTTGVQDWTWVSDDHGWALAGTSCGSSVCVALRETSDGGRTWRSLPTPEALDVAGKYDLDAECATHACLSNVRFATSKIGWLFGPALFRTSDGGQTWTRESSAAVLDVEAAHGVAMRATTARYECITCDSHIDRAHLPATSWQRLSAPGGYLRPQLLLQGSDAYIVNYANGAGAGETYFRDSSDRGTTWTDIADPCAQPPRGYRASGASAAPGGVLVVLCAEVGKSAAAVQISTDRGKTFGARHAVPGSFLNADPIAAATGNTVAVAFSDPHARGILVSNDGGVTWRRALELRKSPSSSNSFDALLGWQDAHTGRASFNTDEIWTTRDAGRTWTENRVAP
jgi:hypothetical protein